MIARLQTFITLGLVALAVAWAVVAARLGHPAWMAGGAVLIGAGYALVMLAEFAVMACVHGADPVPRATVPELLRAWIGEVTTSPRVFCWQQPFRAHAVADHLPGDAPGHGVLLVHGYLCNRGFWNRWMPKLRERGIPFVAVSMQPPFGSIRAHAASLDVAARRLEAVTGRPPVVVAHSMGGLAVRAWLAMHGGAGRAHRIITVGTPHRGTWMARFGTSEAAREMRHGSALLQFLEAHETAAGNASTTCFVTPCDNIVYPVSTGALAGADHRVIRGVAHVHIADHPDVFDEVVRWALPAETAGVGMQGRDHGAECRPQPPAPQSH